MRPLPLAAACLLLGGCTAGADPAARDRLRERTEAYPITGATGEELRAALDRLGPVNDQGGRSDAITRWNFEYTYSVKRSPGHCALYSVETSTEVTTILPRWDPPPAASADLRRKWEAYVACAALHENGHRRIYLDAVSKFRERVDVLDDRPTCDEVVGALDAVAQDIHRAVREDQTSYETRTDHGSVQCGRFP